MSEITCLIHMSQECLGCTVSLRAELARERSEFKVKLEYAISERDKQIADLKRRLEEAEKIGDVNFRNYARWKDAANKEGFKKAALVRELGELQRDAEMLVLALSTLVKVALVGKTLEHTNGAIQIANRAIDLYRERQNYVGSMVFQVQPSPAEPFSLKVKADISDVIPGTLPSDDFPPAAKERELCACHGHKDSTCNCPCHVMIKTPAQGSV